MRKAKVEWGGRWNTMEWDTRHQTQLPQEEKKRNNRFSNSAN